MSVRDLVKLTPYARGLLETDFLHRSGNLFKQSFAFNPESVLSTEDSEENSEQGKCTHKAKRPE